MAFSITFSMAMYLLSSSVSLDLDSWEDLEARFLLEGPGSAEVLAEAALLVCCPEEVEAIVKSIANWPTRRAKINFLVLNAERRLTKWRLGDKEV